MNGHHSRLASRVPKISKNVTFAPSFPLLPVQCSICSLLLNCIGSNCMLTVSFSCRIPWCSVVNPAGCIFVVQRLHMRILPFICSREFVCSFALFEIACHPQHQPFTRSLTAAALPNACSVRASRGC